MDSPTFIDLFSGAGGLTMGLQKAGFEPLLGVDSDGDSVSTLWSVVRHEVLKCDILEFLDQVRSGKFSVGRIDLLAGGPPCQGFCGINPHRRPDDPRNSLVDAFLYAVELLGPRFILMENVTGLLSLAGGRAIKEVERRLTNLGYRTAYRVLQAAHYGVPQSRWRLIVLASKGQLPAFPEPTHSAQIAPNFIRGRELTFSWGASDLFAPQNRPTSVLDAIGDLPPLANGGSLSNFSYQKPASGDYQTRMRQGSSRIANHTTKRLEGINMERVAALRRSGMNWTDLPDELTPKNLVRMKTRYGRRVGAKTRFARLDWDGMFSTIVTSPDPYWGAFIHPEQDRVISVREAARGQSFADQIEFTGSLGSQYRQVGNAVPPLVAEAVGREILKLV